MLSPTGGRGRTRVEILGRWKHYMIKEREAAVAGV